MPKVRAPVVRPNRCGISLKGTSMTDFFPLFVALHWAS